MIMSTEKKRKKFVIYTRCSTDDQAKGDYTTLDAQAHHCKNMLDAFGYDLAEFGEKGVVTDDGYSGKDLNRPGIQSILKDIQKEKSFDGIIFFRLDRLTRNPRDLYGMIDLFRAQEIDFLSVRENLDSSTAIGRVVIGIIGLLSAFERELTGERVKASAIARVRQGKWVAGRVPYGYKLVPDGAPLSNGRQPKRIELDPGIAPHLHVIWEMAADNRSLTEIGLKLAERQIPTPEGMKWRKQSVSKMLKNPFYKGWLHYAGELHKGTHPPVVSEPLWEAANRVLTANLPGHRFIKVQKNYDYEHRLKGILRCGKCGSYFVSVMARGQSGQSFYYYECSRARQGLGCDTKRMSATAFDDAILDFLGRASRDREIIVQAIGDAIKDASEKLDKHEHELRKLEEKLSTAKEKGEKLIALALEGTIPKGALYKEKMDSLETEIGLLTQQISKVQAQKKMAELSVNSSEFLHTNLTFAMEHLREAPAQAQISLLKALIRFVDAYDDRVELRMLINAPLEDVVLKIEAEKQKTPADLLTGEGLTERPKWRPQGDLNPCYQNENLVS